MERDLHSPSLKRKIEPLRELLSFMDVILLQRWGGFREEVSSWVIQVGGEGSDMHVPNTLLHFGT